MRLLERTVRTRVSYSANGERDIESITKLCADVAGMFKRVSFALVGGQFPHPSRLVVGKCEEKGFFFFFFKNTTTLN